RLDFPWMSMETMFSALESSRLARTVMMARETLSLIPAGEGATSAFFRSAVLSVFPFETRTTKSPVEAGDAPKIGRVGLQFQDAAVQSFGPAAARRAADPEAPARSRAKRSPAGNDLSVVFARAAIRREGELGRQG